MEISSLLNSLLGRQPQVRQASTAPVVGLEQLKAGVLLSATVESIVELGATQKQTLLNRITQELSGLTTEAGPREPSTTAESKTTAPAPTSKPADPLHSSIGAARLALSSLARMELLTNPRLLLAEIKLLNESRLIYTNRPLNVGERIQVQVRTDGQLQIVDTEPPKAPAHIDPATPPANKLANPEASQLIAQGLRRYLPQNAPAVELFQTAARLVKVARTIPPEVRAALLPERVWRAVAQLEQRALSPEHLQKPEAIRYVLKHSGHFLESRLAEVVRANMPAGPKPARVDAVRPANEGVSKAGSEPNAGPEPAPVPGGQKPAGESFAVRPILERDEKAMLLALLKELHQPLPPPLAVNTSSVSGTAMSKSADPDLFTVFAMVFNQLGRGLALKQDHLQNQQQLVALLKTQVAAGVARIQTQQLQHLSRASADNLTTTAGGSFEIPVKINENIFPLFIHIQEKPAREKPEEREAKNKKSRPRKKSRRWQVFMEFDLDDLGWFASEITSCDDRVKTLFWAQNNDTRDRARKKLEELKTKLQRSGIEVDEIRCMEGEPPKRPVKIEQNLVDITT